MFKSHEQVWPDDIYPFRYHIQQEKRLRNIHFGKEFFSDGFVECVRESTLKKGLAIELGELKESIFKQPDSNEIEVNEGNPVFRNHIVRERNQFIVQRKKLSVLEAGDSLECEVCGFNFEKVYGDRGANYIECHHDNPLAANDGSIPTKLKDLSLVCSNCHKMIHRFKPWKTVKQIKDLVNERNRKNTRATKRV